MASKQEDISEYWADVEEAWKFLKQSVRYEDYVGIEIGYNNAANTEFISLYQYSLPRNVYERRSWVVRWRQAKIQCENPRRHIQVKFCYYDRRISDNPRALDLLNKMHNHLVQCKVKQRQLEEEQDKQQHTLFADTAKIEKYKAEIKRRISEFKKERCEYLKLKFVCPIDCDMKGH